MKSTVERERQTWWVEGGGIGYGIILQPQATVMDRPCFPYSSAVSTLLQLVTKIQRVTATTCARGNLFLESIINSAVEDSYLKRIEESEFM